MTGFIYTIRRFKSATALNFIGLVIAMFAYYVLMTQINYTCGYNKGLPDYENLYRVEMSGPFEAGKWNTYLSPAYIERASTDVPDVEEVALFECSGYQRSYDINGNKAELVTMKYRKGSLKMFGLKVLDGSADNVRVGEDVLIPASVAKTYFGRVNVAGERLYYKAWDKWLTIAAVYEDFPDNCLVHNAVFLDMSNKLKTEWGNWSFTGYVRLKAGADPVAVARIYNKALPESKVQFRFSPVADTYMSKVSTKTDKGSPGMLIVLELSCLIIMLVAAINFANFSLAEAPSRVKSVTTHRMLGGNVWLLRLKLVGEGVITSVTAMLFAFVLLAAMQQFPDFTGLFNGSLALMDNCDIILQLSGLSVLIGVVATVYPSWYLTSFPMVTVMRSSFATSPKGLGLRKCLVWVQLLVSTLLVCLFGIVNMQKYYVSYCDFGYDKDEVMYIEFSYGEFGLGNKLSMKNEVLKIPGVEAASVCGVTLGSSDDFNQCAAVAKDDASNIISFRYIPVDKDFFKVYGISIIEGREFKDEEAGVTIVNEAFIRKNPFVKLNDCVFRGDSTMIVGICPDVRLGTAHTDNANFPALFDLCDYSMEDWTDRLPYLCLRVSANVDKVKVKHEVEALLSKYWKDGVPECHFLEQDLDDIYREDFIFISQVTMFSALALAITLIGVFCLTMFETEYRRKEIAIRKVLGCSESGILAMLVKHYLIILLAAFAIAAPLALYLGTEWLQSFEERTRIYWWLFPVALLVVGLVLTGTVVAQSWRVANENPVGNLKEA